MPRTFVLATPRNWLRCITPVSIQYTLEYRNVCARSPSSRSGCARDTQPESNRIRLLIYNSIPLTELKIDLAIVRRVACARAMRSRRDEVAVDVGDDRGRGTNMCRFVFARNLPHHAQTAPQPSVGVSKLGFGACAIMTRLRLRTARTAACTRLCGDEKRNPNRVRLVPCVCVCAFIFFAGCVRINCFNNMCLVCVRHFIYLIPFARGRLCGCVSVFFIRRKHIENMHSKTAAVCVPCDVPFRFAHIHNTRYMYG